MTVRRESVPRICSERTKMADDVASATARGVAELQIDDTSVAGAARAAAGGGHPAPWPRSIAEVPGYSGALRGRWAPTSRPRCRWRWPASSSWPPAAATSDPSTPLGPTLEGAYALGRGEARSGRGMDALLAAYRVGARVAWRRAGRRRRRRPGCRPDRWRSSPSWCSPTSTSSPPPASPGTPTSWRPPAGSGSATWSGSASSCSPAPAATCSSRAPSGPTGPPPETLTAVLLPAGAGARARWPRWTGAPCGVGEDLPDLRRPATSSSSLLLVPDVPAATGAACCGCCGPARPWSARPGRGRGAARRTTGRCGCATSGMAGRARAHAPVDTEEHLAALVVERRPEALADLRARVLAPLADLRPATAERLDRDAALLAAAPGPPRRGRRGRSTCTRRRCATGWASCASCTATGSTTRSAVLEPDARRWAPTVRGGAVGSLPRHVRRSW